MKLRQKPLSKPSANNPYGRDSNHLLIHESTGRSLERVESHGTLALQETPSRNHFKGGTVLTLRKEEATRAGGNLILNKNSSHSISQALSRGRSPRRVIGSSLERTEARPLEGENSMSKLVSRHNSTIYEPLPTQEQYFRKEEEMPQIT